MQEEKKVLQVRLRQLALGEREVTNRNENSEAVQLRQRLFADASTSTDDLPSPLRTSTEGSSNPLPIHSLTPGTKVENLCSLFLVKALHILRTLGQPMSPHNHLSGSLLCQVIVILITFSLILGIHLYQGQRTTLKVVGIEVFNFQHLVHLYQQI